jgi:hypothetical protein
MTPKQCKRLAKLCEQAANEHLLAGHANQHTPYTKSQYSCIAFNRAVQTTATGSRPGCWWRLQWSPEVDMFQRVARKLGLDPQSRTQLVGVEDKQQVRYAWLMFVAHLLRTEPELFADL